jgi:hypothetical protein
MVVAAARQTLNSQSARYQITTHIAKYPRRRPVARYIWHAPPSSVKTVTLRRPPLPGSATAPRTAGKNHIKNLQFRSITS